MTNYAKEKEELNKRRNRGHSQRPFSLAENIQVDNSGENDILTITVWNHNGIS